jgi:hypothetical protein
MESQPTLRRREINQMVEVTDILQYKVNSCVNDYLWIGCRPGDPSLLLPPS